VPVAIRLCLLGCGLAAALVLPGCGGGTGTATGRPTTETRTQTQTSSPVAARKCQGQVGGFLGSMDSLRRRLAVGLAYEQYVDEVESIRAAYRRIPSDELEVTCLTKVGAPSEKGFNEYIEAANTWGECVGEAGCESATVEPTLQRKWRVASGLLSEARQGLRELGAG
jgi:hypothetical protein